jgi:hypothetical protein
MLGGPREVAQTNGEQSYRDSSSTCLYHLTHGCIDVVKKQIAESDGQECGVAGEAGGSRCG